MATSRYKYQTNAGNIFYVITDNDTEVDAIRGAAPTATATEEMTIISGKGARQGGIKPRQAVLARTIGTPVAGTCSITTGKAFKRVAILTQSQANSLTLGTVYSINGVNYKLQSISREKVH